MTLYIKRSFFLSLTLSIIVLFGTPTAHADPALGTNATHQHCVNNTKVVAPATCVSTGTTEVSTAAAITTDPATAVATAAPNPTQSETLGRYKLLETIPGVVNRDESIKNFPQYIKGIFNFGISIIGISALVMITIGGFWYITSAGNQTRTSTAKTIITDAFLGLFLALFAWLILNTINPNLVTGGLASLQNGTPDANAPTTTTTTTSTESGVVDTTTDATDRVGYCHESSISQEFLCFQSESECEDNPNRSADKPCGFFEDTSTSVTPDTSYIGRIVDCLNCTSLQGNAKFNFKSLSRNGCKDYPTEPATQCMLDANLITKLNTVYDSGITNFELTESWPPTLEHQAPCHYNGTCADVAIRGALSSIIKFYKEALDAGLKPEYEVLTTTEENEVWRALKDAGVSDPIVKKIDGIPGSHFSVY